MTRNAVAVLFLAGVAFAGCGLRDPYSEDETSAVRGRVAQASMPASTPAHTTDAEALLARYATTWVNWSAMTLPRQRAALLSLATGALADELRRDAAQAVKAQLQEASNAYSRGKYVGVIREPAGRAIVVTYEEVAPLGGAAQGAYHVYLARTERVAQGWRVREWQPATDS